MNNLMRGMEMGQPARNAHEHPAHEHSRLSR